MTDTLTSAKPITDLMFDMASAFAKLATIPRVYPAYIGSRIKKALAAADTESIITSIGDVETIGDCRHAITVTDFNGTEYRITIEVVDRRAT